MKFGFSGEDAPRDSILTVVGTPRHGIDEAGMNSDSVYVGEEALKRKGILKLQYPIEHGIIQDWDAMQNIW